jgi:hypothetical protein
MQTSRFLLFRRLIIFVLAGLLTYYHTYTLYDLYLSAGTSSHTAFEYIQSALRVVITLSLLLVVFGNRWALAGTERVNDFETESCLNSRLDPPAAER